MATQTMPVEGDVHDTFPINGTDYIEFYVGNAKQASQYYQSAFGFQLVAYRGPEIADHVRKHGDGVRDIALWVDDARDAYAKAVERGAKSAYAPRVQNDDAGEVVSAGIEIYGDTIHSLVERKNYRGVFFPGFQRR